MIFGFLVKALKVIVDGFASVCAFLLVTLGLWLPAVYSLLFLIVCAIAGVKLEGTAITLYIIGLVITFLGSVGISVLKFNRKKKSEKHVSRAAQSNVKSVKKREYRERREDDFYRSDIEEQEPVTYEQDAISAPTPPERFAESAPQNTLYSQEKSAKYDDFSDLRKKYFGDGEVSDTLPQNVSGADRHLSEPPKDSYADVLRQSGFNGNGNDYGFLPKASNDALSREQLERRLMGIKTEEQPMVFATRRDPNIIVYEYSDRLKFYKKTKRGLIHISTEFKK